MSSGSLMIDYEQSLSPISSAYISRQYHQHRLRAVSQLKDSRGKRTSERARKSPDGLKRDARVETLV